MTVPDINPNGTFLVSLSAIGALDLTAGPAVIPIKLTYRDFEGETYESSVSFSVNVEAVTTSTQLTISEYITEPDPVIPGSPVLVQIVGAPVACATGTTTTWRSVSAYVADQLTLYFGDDVRVVYHDLFDAGCPPLPEGGQLPLVLVDGAVVSSGGKLSVPTIRRAVAARPRRG